MVESAVSSGVFSNRLRLGTQHIPVVAISANAMPHDIYKGLQAGFFRYLTKPIKVIEFMDAVDVALEFSRTASRSANDKRAA